MGDAAMPPLRGGVFATQEPPGGSADGAGNTVRIVAWPGQPLAVNEAAERTVSFKGDVPVCIRVCEPICARSDYTIAVTLFDRPVASITVSGTTRIENCGGTPPRREDWPPRSPAAEAAPGTIAETAKARRHGG
jgi:hypothetical protein